MENKDVIQAANAIKTWCENHYTNCVECPFDEGANCTLLRGLPHKWEIKEAEHKNP